MMSSRNPSLIFEEDEVSRVVDHRKEYGLVIETSEYLSSEDEYDDEETERVRKGTVRVAWYPTGEENIVDEHAVYLEDRSLMPGDVVRRLIAGENSQRGFVRDMRVLCDLNVIGTNEIVRAVDSRNLLKTEPWDGESELITLDSWVGRVEYVTVDIIVRFTDGARLKLFNVDIADDGFSDVHDIKRAEESEFRSKVFYEGQILEQTYRALVDREIEWLHQTKQHGSARSLTAKAASKKVRVSVEEVLTREVDVHWMCRGYSQTDVPPAKLHMPPRAMKADAMARVHRLDYFDHCSIQIGDRAYYRPPRPDGSDGRDGHHVMEAANHGTASGRHVMESANHGPAPGRRSCSPLHGATSCAAAEETMENGHPETNDSNDDSEGGQDRTRKTSSSNKRVLVSRHIHQQPRSRMRTTAAGHRANKRRTAHQPKDNSLCPVEVIHTLSVVDVMWQDTSVEENLASYDLYPIHHLDELEFFPGDFVVRANDTSAASSYLDYGVVCRVDHCARTCMVKWVEPYQLGKSDKPTETEPTEMSVYDIKDHPDYKFRPDQAVVRVCGYESSPGCSQAAGQIVDIDPSGRLLVRWADGIKSYAYPQEVFLIGDENSEFGSSDWGSEADDSICSWETEEEETDTDTDGEDAHDGHSVDRKSSAASSNGCKSTVNTSHGDKDEEIPIGPGDKLELDYLLDRVETSLDRIQPDVIDRIVDCYKNVLNVYKRCQDLDRVLGSAYFEDKELGGIVAQVKRELRREKQNKMQTQLLQQAKSFVVARKSLSHVCDEDEFISVGERNDDAAESQYDVWQTDDNNKVVKSKSEPNLAQTNPVLKDNVKVLKQCAGGLAPVSLDVFESELCANLERARDVCGQALRCLRLQIMRVREQLDAIWQRKVEQMKRVQPTCDSPSPDGQVPDGQLPDTPCSPSGANARIVPQLMSPLTPDQAKMLPAFDERFTVLTDVPSQHRFHSKEHLPQDPKSFMAAVRREIRLLRSSLPAGIKVVGFEDRMDLYSVLIVGPSSTPYEDGLFFFDVQLSNSYPSVPPFFHYLSYCSERLNPNLYEDGKVCVSLLGTWGGKGTELWSSSSNMLQVLISIQGLILNAEPYYNEAGYEKQRGTQMGQENSQVYNEMAILKLVQSMIKILNNPPAVFKDDVIRHMMDNASRMIGRLESWIAASNSAETSTSPPSQPHPSTHASADTSSLRERPDFPLIPRPDVPLIPRPDFPLIPASRGFCLTLQSRIDEFRLALGTHRLL